MTATTDRCPGCHGSGIEMSGVTYAGISEYVGCHECGPECPDDCGCRASDATERPESIAPRHPGATQSPDGSQGATEHVEITPDGNVQVMTTSWHEGSPYSCARPGCPAGCDRNDPTTEASSDVRPVPPARDAELVAYEAAAAAAYETGLLGGLSREERAARHAALARGAESVPSAAQIGAESITVDVRRWASHMADRLDQAEAENARMRQVAELRVGTWRDTAARLEGERDRARGTAATLEAENARLREGIEALMRDVGKAQPAHVTPGIVAVRLKALLAEDEGGE